MSLTINSSEEINVPSFKEEEMEDDDDYRGDVLKLEIEDLSKVGSSSKCGEVIFVDSQHLILVCTLCRRTFEDWVLFGNHIRNLHSEKTFELYSIETIQDNEIENSNDYQLDVPDLDTNQSSEASVASEENPLEADDSDAELPEEELKPKDSTQSDDVILDNALKRKKGKRKGGMRGKANTPFVCPKCDGNYSSRHTLLKHIKIFHGNEFIPPSRRETRCRYCGDIFDDAKQLKAHKDDQHMGDAKFACPYCDKMFRTHTGRQVHICSHTGERPYKCPHCPKAFAVSSNLKKHIHSHLNVRPYACKFCDKKFVQSGERNIHQRRHTGEKPYQCEECGISVLTHTLLVKHRTRHDDTRNYKCDKCPKAFYDAGTLKRHGLVHTSERPFQCTICDKSFVRRRGLEQHSYIHSDVKQFVCVTCGKAFAQKSGLSSHLKTHGPFSK